MTGPRGGDRRGVRPRRDKPERHLPRANRAAARSREIDSRRRRPRRRDGAADVAPLCRAAPRAQRPLRLLPRRALLPRRGQAPRLGISGLGTVDTGARGGDGRACARCAAHPAAALGPGGRRHRGADRPVTARRLHELPRSPRPLPLARGAGRGGRRSCYRGQQLTESWHATGQEGRAISDAFLLRSGRSLAPRAAVGPVD